MTKKISKYEEVKSTLARMDDNFRASLPKSIESEKFQQTVLLAVRDKPELLEANRNSLYMACLKAAADGLILDNREAALVVFGSTVQYMPMAEGIVQKILSTGKYKTVQAEVVCENDEFESWIDEHGPHWKHVKARKNRGKPVLAYAYAIDKDGGTSYEEMNVDEVVAVRKVSKTKKIWAGDFGNEMWRKSPLRRLAKKLLTNSDLANVFSHDDANYDLEASVSVDADEVKEEGTVASRAIAEQMPDVKAEKPEPEEELMF